MRHELLLDLSCMSPYGVFTFVGWGCELISDGPFMGLFSKWFIYEINLRKIVWCSAQILLISTFQNIPSDLHSQPLSLSDLPWSVSLNGASRTQTDRWPTARWSCQNWWHPCWPKFGHTGGYWSYYRNGSATFLGTWIKPLLFPCPKIMVDPF